MQESSESVTLGIAEDDLILLESLIRSPVFAALRRTLDRYRKECQAVLLSASDVHKLYQTQGRVIGLNTIESLPQLLVAQRNERLKKEKEKEKEKKIVGRG